MPLHLVKLCVGVSSPDELAAWVEQRFAQMREAGEPQEQRHTTRQLPNRANEILDGGSLYWVIRGAVQVRQPILAIRPFQDADGIRRCHLVLEPRFVLTELQPRRAFQGWRYLRPADAPPDLGAELGDLDGLPPRLRRELATLGLL